MVYVPININEAVKRECRRRRYSERTIGTYVYSINKFIQYTHKSVDKISKKDAHEFLTNLSEKGAAGSTMNVYHMAIKFFLEEILRKNMRLNIKYSKVPEKIPVVLTRDEVKKLFDAIRNEKHKLMIQLMYGAGLRASELLNLKVADLDMDNNYGFVRRGKGNKDRLFIIAESLTEKIQNLILLEKLTSERYLFNSNRNTKYDIRSLQEIIKRAVKTASMKKEAHPHTLRHSFATHLIEQGSSVSEVQSLLGHKSPETTQIYLHTATKNMINAKSPIDYI